VQRKWSSTYWPCSHVASKSNYVDNSVSKNVVRTTEPEHSGVARIRQGTRSIVRNLFWGGVGVRHEGAQIERPKASRGKGMGRERLPPHPTRVSGERRIMPIRKPFLCILSVAERLWLKENYC